MFSPTTFAGQQPDEKIIVVLHRHWWVLVSRGLSVIGLILLPAIIVGVVTVATDFQLTVGTLSYTLLVMGGSLYLMFLLLLLYGHWLDYALDVFIISDKRLVDIEQAGLFNRVVAEQRLHRVQDVTYEVKGVMRTFFKFGDVYIQTAGEQKRFVFEDVPHPDRVTELILQYTDRARRSEPIEPSAPAKILQSSEPVAHHQHPPTPNA